MNRSLCFIAKGREDADEGIEREFGTTITTTEAQRASISIAPHEMRGA